MAAINYGENATHALNYPQPNSAGVPGAPPGPVPGPEVYNPSLAGNDLGSTVTPPGVDQGPGKGGSGGKGETS